MGIVSTIARLFFGGGRNAIVETVEVFRPNAERSAQRGSDLDQATLAQMSSEFNARNNRGWFDQLMDGVNRIPRPLMVFSCFGLLVYTPVDPLKMAEVFAAWALIPTGMWTIIGVIVAFYFGGRAQLKGQDFQSQMAASVSLAPSIIENIQAIRALRHDSPNVATDDTDMEAGSGDNPAVSDWKSSA